MGKVGHWVVGLAIFGIFDGRVLPVLSFYSVFEGVQLKPLRSPCAISILYFIVYCINIQLYLGYVGF